jgi:hypothetical protein
MVAPLLIGAGASLLGGLLGSNSGSTTINQVPMLTEEQKKAIQGLSNYYSSGGKLPGVDYNAGQTYGDSLGSYGMTGVEGMGQNQLMNLMNAGLPKIYGMGTDKLSELLNTDKFDPFSEKGVYSGFKKNALKELGESKDRLKRDSAVTGSLYSTNTGNQTRKLEENTTGSLNSKLAELYDTFVQRQIGAIPTALAAGQTEQNMNLAQIGASQQFGALQRILEDQKLKDKYAEYVRTQGEKQSQIQSILGSMSTVAGGSGNFGVPSVTVPNQNQLGNSLMQGGLGFLGKWAEKTYLN